MNGLAATTEATRTKRNSGHWHALECAAHADGMLSRDEERRLARLARGGDERAFDRLVRAHIPLVFAMAYEFRSYGLPLEELVGEGLLGLVKAARDFDSERGTRLATYAAWWIRARMRNYTVTNRRIVRGPSTRNARKLLSRLRKTENELKQRDGQSPSSEAVAAALEVSPGDVEEMRAILGGRDVVYGIEGDGGRSEIASSTPTPEAIAEERDRQRSDAEQLKNGLAQLDARARRILESRYLSKPESTLSDLSDELGLSRERVRQIEAQAKANVRAAIAAAS